jgi:hypothetical protein
MFSPAFGNISSASMSNQAERHHLDTFGAACRADDVRYRQLTRSFTATAVRHAALPHHWKCGMSEREGVDVDDDL